jgi:hypothetical protein
MKQPSIGRQVHYFDREEIVNADQQGRPPEPFAATITRVLKDDQGKPTDVVTLSVLDPELGCSVARDVHPGEDYTHPTAGTYYWPPLLAEVPDKPGAHPGAHPDQDLPGRAPLHHSGTRPDPDDDDDKDDKRGVGSSKKK